MESKVDRMRGGVLVSLLGVMLAAGFSLAQETASQVDEGASAEINLQKTIGVRQYHGKNVEGDEREIRVGETLWHILVREKGLPGERFKEYFVLIRGLNPQLTTPEALRAGDKLFIPLRPHETLGFQNSSEAAARGERTFTGQGTTQDYTVKPGEHLYQILRTQLGALEDRKLWQYFALVKDLNPQKNNWDIIEKGEVIRLPVAHGYSESSSVASAVLPASPRKATGGESIGAAIQATPALAGPAPGAAIDLAYAQRLSARENFDLIGMVAESLGNEVQRSGDEIVALKDGAIRLDKTRFPVIYNQALDQRVILDGENNIPDSLRANLKQQSVNAPVVSLARNTTLQEAVGQLLARLGYQPLPAERPVVIHDGGVAFEAKGQWAVMAPQQSNRPQEIIVINLADGTGEIPAELQMHLRAKGLHLENVLLANSTAGEATVAKAEPPALAGQARNLPRQMPDLIDALLIAYQIPFGVKDTLAAELHGGLNVEISVDRTFEFRGRKTALFFRSIDPAIKAALEKNQAMKTIELDLAALKPRELIAQLLGGLGESAAYKEHRFSAAKGSLQDRLVMTAAGFLLSGRSLFLTDREIPARFQRIFFEKGLDIVYFH